MLQGPSDCSRQAYHTPDNRFRISAKRPDRRFRQAMLRDRMFNANAALSDHFFGTPQAQRTGHVTAYAYQVAALETINAERETLIRIRRSKYLNNLVEQDHWAIKRRMRPMQGQQFRCPRILLGSIEVKNTIAKRQMKRARKTHPFTVDHFYELAT